MVRHLPAPVTFHPRYRPLIPARLALGLVLPLLLVLGTAPVCAERAATAPQAFGWHELPGTAIQPVCPPNGFGGYGYAFADKCRFVTGAWSSGALDRRRNRLYVLGGGHNDYYGNEIYAIDLARGKTTRLTDPAPVADFAAEPRQSELAPFNGTQPNSRHTYDGVVYIEHADRLWMYSGALAGRGSANRDNLTWLFDPERKAWHRATPKGDIPKTATGLVAAYDPVSRLVYLHDRNGLYSYEYAPDGGTYRRLAGGPVGLGVNAAIDPEQRLFVIVGGGEFIIYDLRPDSGYARREPELRGDSDIVSMSAPGLDYHPGLRQLVGWGGGKRVFRLDGESLSWSATAHRGGPPQPAMRGTYGRWAYDPDVDAFVVYNDVADNAYTFRPMVARQDTRPPAAPGRPRVESPYQGSALLRWDIPEDDTGVAEFRIYRDGERIAESLDPIFRELGLAAGKRYAYRVSAVDSAGNESARSEEVFIEPPPPAVKLPLGDCTLETRLGGRADVVFCEPWESPRWWQSGYLNDPIVADPRRAGEPDVALTRIVEEGCVAGSCLRIETPRDVTKSLSVYWPLNNAGLAPETLYMRYYLKLGEGWDPFMCRKDGTRVGAGGKFPGPADVRTWADPVKQCGNGGKRGNGIDCWSARSNYRHCASRDGLDCASKPDAIARFGSYLYHARQSGSTGDAGFWDGHGHGSTGGGGKSCESSPHNLVCGRGDGGVLEPERWYRIEIETAMNTPGAADGVIRGWVDGELSYEKTNMVFREPGHDLLHNRLAWLNVYKGGVHGNCSEGAVFLDQLVLAIGEPAGGLDERTLRPPRVDLAALADDADTKGKVTLRWRTEDAASCRASGLWSGEKALAGTEAISVPDAGGEARLVCAGAGGETVRAWAAPGSVRPPGAARRRPSEPLPVPRRASADAPLPPPTGLQSVSQADGAIELRWEPVPGASRYRVALGELLVAVVDAPRFVSSPFPPGAAPRFRVAAVADGGHVSALSAGAPAVDREAGAVPATAADTVARASFAVVSDTYLAASTRSPLGERPAVLVNSRHSTLLAFPFALPPGARVERAALHLTSVYQYADLTLGVFVPAGTWHESRSTYLEADTLLRERWQSAGGDWLDARDQPQGDVPFASADLPKNGHPYEATIDVTALVRRWHADELANTGVFLRALASGGAGQKFASREGDEPAARLVVEYRLPSP